MSESCGCFNVYSVTFMFTVLAVSLFTLSQVVYTVAAHAKTYDCRREVHLKMLHCVLLCVIQK